MRLDLLNLHFLGRYRAYGAFFIRLAFGAHLIYFTQDNVFSYARMLEFRDFLQIHGFPFPLFCAFLSVAVQFTSGVLVILGAFVRPVSVLILVNFVVALVMVHAGNPYEQYYPALQLVAVALFLLFNGAGKASVDEWLEQRKKGRSVPRTVA